MKRRIVPVICLIAGLVIGLGLHVTRAGDNNDKKLNVTASFGGGLNTAQPGNAANHVVLPRTIEVRERGVVTFFNSGFHQIVVYKPGTRTQDIVVPPSGTFINHLTNLYYQGISPAGAAPTGFSNALNRVESVSFTEPGKYLVICNVRGHYLGGMFGYVEVDD